MRGLLFIIDHGGKYLGSGFNKAIAYGGAAPPQSHRASTVRHHEHAQGVVGLIIFVAHVASSDAHRTRPVDDSHAS